LFWNDDLAESSRVRAYQCLRQGENSIAEIG
jgi:hypothetical protein